jgi:hypothetical protein
MHPKCALYNIFAKQFNLDNQGNFTQIPPFFTYCFDETGKKIKLKT